MTRWAEDEPAWAGFLCTAWVFRPARKRAHVRAEDCRRGRRKRNAHPARGSSPALIAAGL